MPIFGLSPTGFRPMRLLDILEQTKSDLRAALSPDMTFDETDPETQLISVLADRIAEIWEEVERVYASQDPDRAEGEALVRLGALNLLAKLPESKSNVTLRIYGIPATLIAAGDFEASVNDNPDIRFKTVEPVTLDTPYNTIHFLAFSDVPDSGDFTLKVNGASTASLPYNATFFNIQTAINAAAPAGVTVAVTGDFVDGFLIEWTGAAAATDQLASLELDSNTLLDIAAAPITQTLGEDQVGGIAGDALSEALVVGPLAAVAGSVTVIETAIVGVDRVLNPDPADTGSFIETDAAFRLRRANSLQRAGTAPLEGIRAAIGNVANVDTVFGFENASDVVDGEGRPPHSIEMVVLGGSDEDIARAIWASKAAGIQTFGTEEVTFEDDFGTNRTVFFSRPEEVEIWMEIDVTPNTDPNETDVYPGDGDDLVKEAVLAFALVGQPVGRDVIVTRYYTPVNSVPGVNDIAIRVGLAPSPGASDNVVITARQVAVFDTSRLTVSQV